MSIEKELFLHNRTVIEERIRQAASRVGRDHEDIKIVAVSKTKPAQMVLQAYDAGFRVFGENKVQEMLEKQESAYCKDLEIEWHLIGHLQTNKVRQVIGKAALIHSVDRMNLAYEIQKCAEKKNIISNILIQVNVGREDTKSGFYLEETREAVDLISKLHNIRIHGLMTIAPFRLNPEENRKLFRELYEIYIDINREKKDNVIMSILSMGMSNDFEVAVEEGANMVRIGTAVFGERI